MRIAICDDMIKEIKLIRLALKSYILKEIENSFEIKEYNSSLLFLDDLASQGGFDIVFLDICMPGVLGTDIAKEIRQRKDKTEIVFLTTSDEFAVEAFALKAAHYVVKPFTQSQFNEAMDRAMERFAAKQTKNISLKVQGGGVKIIDINDICFIENFSHTQNIHLKDNECFEVRQSISEIISMLEGVSKGQFIIPYKGYIVNLKSIQLIQPDKIILRDGQAIPIVKRNFRQFREQYFDYMFEGESK